MVLASWLHSVLSSFTLHVTACVQEAGNVNACAGKYMPASATPQVVAHVLLAVSWFSVASSQVLPI